MSVTTQASSRELPGALMWSLLMAAAAVGGSLAFACITPFAAFAALAAVTQKPRAALGTMALIWAANQAVGFAFLQYPFDASTLLWGLAILAAALLAAAVAIARLDQGRRWLSLAFAFAVAFAVYELALLIPSLFTGESANFAPGIIGDLAWIDLAWLAGMAVLHEILVFARWPGLSSLNQPA